MANYFIDSPRKRGTVASIDGTTFVKTAGTDFTSADVGRIIMMQTGDSRGYYRRITGFTNSTTVTVDAEWGVSPFRTVTDLRTGNLHTETAPVAGDTFAVSKTMSEARDEVLTQASEETIDTILEDVGGLGRYYKFHNENNHRFIFDTYVVVYDEDITVEWRYGLAGSNNVIDIRTNDGFGSIVLGRQNLGDTSDDSVNGFPSNGCVVIDTSPSPIGGTNFENRGVFEMNGGRYYATDTNSSNTGTFLRFNDFDNDTNDAQQQFRMWNTEVSGKFGARVSGDRSVLFGVRGSGNPSEIGMFSPIRPGIYQNIETRGSGQGIYFFPRLSGDTTVEAQAVQSLDNQVVFMNRSTAETEATTQIIKNWSINGMEAAVDAGTNLFGVGGTADFEHTFRIEKELALTFTNTDGSALDQQGQAIFVDTDNLETTDSDDGAGAFPAQSLLAYDWTGNTALTNFEAASITKYYPYNYAIKYRNYNLFTGNTNLSGPIGPIETTLGVATDENITNTNITQVDGYTNIDNAQELYDYADKFKHENMSLPTYDTQWVTIAGDTITMTDRNVPVKFDSSATDVMSNDTDWSLTYSNHDFDPNAGHSVDSWAIRQTDATDAPLINNPGVWSSWSGFYLHLRRPNGEDDNAYGLFNFLHSNSDILGQDLIDISFGDNTATASFSISDSFTPTTVDSDKTLIVRLGTLQTGSTGTPVDNATDDSITIATTHGRQFVIKTGGNGYNGNIIATNSTVEFDSEIQGDVTCQYIHHSFTDGDTIISSGTINGTIFLPAGNFTISAGDISDLTVRRQDGETGNVVLILTTDVTGTGDATLGDGVEFQNLLAVTVNNFDSTDGRISFFDSDNKTAFHEISGSAIESSIELTSTDHPELVTGAVINVVYSGGAFKDDSDTVTLVAGSNSVTVSPASQSYPSLNAGAQAIYDQYTDNSRVDYDTDSDDLTVELVGVENSGVMGDGTFNNWLNTFVRGTTSYNQLVRFRGLEPGTSGNNAIDSIGAESGGQINGKYVSVIPGNNRSYTVGFVINTDSDDPQNDIPITRTVVDTGDSSITFDFVVTFPSSPSNFDIATTATVVGTEVENRVDTILDDRSLTQDNVGNLGLLKPAKDADGDILLGN